MPAARDGEQADNKTAGGGRGKSEQDLGKEEGRKPAKKACKAVKGVGG